MSRLFISFKLPSRCFLSLASAIITSPTLPAAPFWLVNSSPQDVSREQTLAYQLYLSWSRSLENHVSIFVEFMMATARQGSLNFCLLSWELCIWYVQYAFKIFFPTFSTILKFCKIKNVHIYSKDDQIYYIYTSSTYN